MKTFHVALVACTGVLLGMTPVHAGQAEQGREARTYPNKPIRVVVPAAPGGPADVIARALSEHYSKVLGQTVIIDNRSGAAGSIGAELVSKAPSDGYTLMLTHSGPLVIEPILHERPSYDSLRDFVPISLVGATPLLLLVNPKLPVYSVKELVDYARARPGKLNYASGGNGTVIHLAAELLKASTGMQITHLPYKGAGPAMTAVLAGEADMMVNGLSSARPQMKAGRVRALAVTSHKRTPLAPELPSISESGIPFDVSGWYSLLAPAGTPKAIVNKLHADLVKTLVIPEVKERFATLGLDPVGSTPDALGAHMRTELKKWEQLIRSAGVKAE